MNAERSESNHVVLDLTRDEALVVFDCLSRWDDAQLDLDVLPFVDHAERWLFWSLVTGFESILVEPFQADYGELIERARAAI